MWSYIIDTYGEAVVPNILYMARVTQSIDKGFLYASSWEMTEAN